MESKFTGKLALAAMDGCAIMGAFFWAVSYGVEPGNTLYWETVLPYLPYSGVFLVLWALASVDQRLYGPRNNEEISTYIVAVTKSVGHALVVCTVLMALFSRRGVEGEFLVAFGLGTLGLVLAFRMFLRMALWILRKQGYNFKNILVVGGNERASHLVDLIQKRAYYGYRIAGFLEDDAERTALLKASGIEYWGGLDQVENILRQKEVDEIYVALPIGSFYETIESIAKLCEQRKVPMRLLADLFPLRIATNRLMYVEDIPLLSLSAIPEEQVRQALKRAVDLVVSSILLVGLGPVLLVIAVVIKLDSAGPIFFAQERVGQNQRRFKMLKYRSMVEDAEAQRSGLDDLNEADGPVFKIRNDPRITKVGKFLRVSSLDELPQLINVWMGQMSLVGPRPPLASEVEQYTWDQRRRLSVKPGMTGLWQVSGRSDVDFEQWVELDLAYIDTWSLWQDFFILLRTFRAVIRGRGAV